MKSVHSSYFYLKLLRIGETKKKRTIKNHKETFPKKVDHRQPKTKEKKDDAKLCVCDLGI